MTTRPLAARTARRRPGLRPRLAAMAVVAASAVLGATFTGASASAVPVDPGCLTSYPVSSLAPGDAVHGLTVTRGTDPTSGAFTGTVQGVLEDGIAPGVDMILVNLTSPTIDKVGIWAGMSGSPVYASNGELIGAVSYSLGLGPSTIAGVTPAAQMRKLLDGNGGTALRAARTVAVPRSVRARLVAAGAATSAQADQGMSRIRLPYTVSGVSTERVASLAKVLDVDGGHFTAGSGGPTSQERIPVQTGGNLAASLSYGTVSAAALGTATMVCGDEVVGFGHPMNFSGPATLSLHGARAITIQDDPTVSGFKVANIGAPIGTVDNDRLAGIHGATGALPPSSDIGSQATSDGRSATGTTHVTDQDLVPDLDFSHLVAVQDQALDRIGKGVATADWTITGLRRDGTTPFRFHRTDMYADPEDISAATGFAFAQDLSEIIDNTGEVVTITSVHAHTRFRDAYRTYAIAKVQVQFHGQWITARRHQPVPVRPGHLAHLKVLLTSRQAAPRTLRTNVHVPWHTLGQVGTLRVVGGDVDAEASDEFFDLGFDAFDPPPAPSPSALPALLKDMSSGLKHNQVRATLRFRQAPANASRPRTSTHRLSDVVGGSLSVPAIAVP